MNYEEFIILHYTPEIQNYNLIKALLISTTDLKAELIGFVLLMKIINHITVTRLEFNLIKFYLNIYLNQYSIIIIKYKIEIQNYVVAIVYTFFI